MQKTWRLINELMDRKIREPLDIQLKRNFNTTDLTVLANNLNGNFINQIREIKNKNKGSILDVEIKNHTLQRVNSSMHLRKASEKDIRDILNKMKNTGKGIDGIRHNDIISNSLYLAPVITHLVNLMIKQAKIPHILKTSCITPLYKKGKKDVLGNYRPVGSMPVVEKVLEKFINSQTKKYLDENNIIPEFQHGFQTGRSTMTLLQEFSDQINTALDERKCVVVLLLDLSFAFDSINHEYLIRKFHEIGISQPIFRHYFEGRRQVTRIGDETSSELPVEQGLVQGGINSPTWYNIYTYDIKYIEITGSLKMFADDSCIISIHKDVSMAVKNAQRDFINIQKYLYNNEIYLNEKKTEAMVLGFMSKRIDMNNYRIFCHSRQCLALKLYVSNNCSCHQVEYKENVKYLGVHLDREFKMKEHTFQLMKKMRILNYKFIKTDLAKLPLTTKKTVYFSLIDSILRYGVTLYTYAPKFTIEPLYKLQRKILKTLFGEIEIGCLTPEQLSVFVTLSTFFFDSRFRQLNDQPHSLRVQRFRRPKVYTIEFGDRRLEYLVPRLLNTYCQGFFDEENKNLIKHKLKKSIISLH